MILPHSVSQNVAPCCHLQQNNKKRKSDFIPYRDSVLTWLLKENLGERHIVTTAKTSQSSKDKVK